MEKIFLKYKNQLLLYYQYCLQGGSESDRENSYFMDSTVSMFMKSEQICEAEKLCLKDTVLIQTSPSSLISAQMTQVQSADA